MKKLTVLLSILVLALGILAAGCGGGDKKADDKKAAAPAPAAKEELIVGTEPSFAPFEFPEKDSKEFTFRYGPDPRYRQGDGIQEMHDQKHGL